MKHGRRQLVVVRHAKSAYPSGVPDVGRPLAERGIADAPRVGARLHALVGAVDVAVVSPAQRTRETWALLAEQLDPVPDVRIDERIYRDWGAGLLEVVRDLPGSAATALVLGHEPGVSELVLRLADHGARELRDRIDLKFPTCAVAVLGVAGAWADVRPGAASLEAFLTPKD
ncbi:MAG: histidine phosphatase family protein [Candidatus Nanopelagicales bacterium]|nr:histidine phosphatase family protein [Candidatus Nanopelagicales bacterium]